MMKITAHFDSIEFACKDRERTEYPAQWLETRLTRLCDTLEAIRAAAGVPLRIVSGYRTPEYNQQIHGAPLSQHTQGRAADIRCSLSAPQLHALILQLHSEGKLPHLGGLGEYPTFVHVDVRPGKVLTRWRG